MINLDNLEAILQYPKSQAVLTSIQNLPRQIVNSWNLSSQFSLPDHYRQVKSIVICGMGGSRFPILIVKELFKEEITIPTIICDDYRLPGFVNQDTLVIGSSYSGNTEEVIFCLKKAKDKGAKLLGITSGGELEKIAQSLNFPCLVFSPEDNPSGQPRLGFGYALGSFLGILKSLELLIPDRPSLDQVISESHKLTQDFEVKVPESSNPAKQLAREIFEKVPVYVVSEFLSGLGNAIANQTNETAKSGSQFRIIPELNHHLMEGLAHPEKNKEVDLFVFFYSALYSPAIQKRFKITRSIVEKRGFGVLWYELKQKSKINQAFELLILGSFLTFYLSALYQEDPAAIPFVNYFKKRLEELKNNS